MDLCTVVGMFSQVKVVGLGFLASPCGPVWNLTCLKLELGR